MIATIAVIGVLAVVNLLNNRWAQRHYLLISFAGTAVLLAIARIDDISWFELGLARRTWTEGLIWSAIIVAAVTLFYGVAVGVPFTRRRGFADQRAAEGGWGRMLYHTVIRIPFGTAMLEETAFRGVLLAIAVDVWGWWIGIAISSFLFGLWHVLPSLDFHESHEAAGMLGEGRAAQVRSVVLTVVGTAAAGVGFCALRYFSGSLFPPLALHAALNGIGFALAWGLARKGQQVREL